MTQPSRTLHRPITRPASTDAAAEQDFFQALCRPKVRSLVEAFGCCDDPRLDLIRRFTEEVIATHDPNAVDTFLAWKAQPVLDTLLLLAARLNEDAQDELLSHAEDLWRESRQASGN
jgi:hypothetical protein